MTARNWKFLLRLSIKRNKRRKLVCILSDDGRCPSPTETSGRIWGSPFEKEKSKDGLIHKRGRLRGRPSLGVWGKPWDAIQFGIKARVPSPLGLDGVVKLLLFTNAAESVLHIPRLNWVRVRRFSRGIKRRVMALRMDSDHHARQPWLIPTNMTACRRSSLNTRDAGSISTQWS